MATANIIGAGPNGLAAAITLARAGVRPVVWERNAWVGGGVHSAELTLPGFVHDVCSAVYPLGVASPFFRRLELERHGLRWVQPTAALAHPLDDGSAVMLERSIDETAAGLSGDGAAWRELIRPLAAEWEELLGEIMGPVAHLPRHPLLLARFGLLALQPAERLAQARFKGERARALFAGCAAHAVLPLTAVGSSAIALVLAAAGHTTGWPIVQGGAQRLADALAAEVLALGGEIRTGVEVQDLAQLPKAEATLCDVTPRQFAAMTQRLPEEYRARMLRYKYGPGAVKVDWALGEAIPWRASECKRAATVHVGGRMEEIAAWEAAAFRGRVPDAREAKPFVLLVQPSLFDATRAPAGQHTAWAYCHVPHGWDGDVEAMADAMERQVERFAPGFRECVLMRSVRGPRELEAMNPNLVGGDISGGAMTLRQLVLRPTATLYRTPLDGVYLCSSSTPPGGGVHGMCGHRAAKMALLRMR